MDQKMPDEAAIVGATNPKGRGSEAKPEPLQILFAAPTGIAALPGNSVCLARAPRRPNSRRSTELYWDTQEHDLGRAGWAMAQRRVGRRRSQILLDVSRVPAAGRRQRVFEIGDQPPLPDPLRFAFVAGLDPRLVGRLVAKGLVPIFAVERKRTTWRVPEGGSIVGLTVEAATIDVAGGRHTIDQVELTLISGADGDLYHFARSLAAELGLTLAPCDPIQRAYEIVAPDLPAPALPALNPGLPIRDALGLLGRVASADLRARLADLPAELGSTNVHEIRVCLRRLRSLLTVFRSALPESDRRAVAAELGGLAGALGPVREWDVVRAETLAPLRRGLDRDPAAAGLIGDLIDTAERSRAAAAIQARAALEPRRVVPLLLSLGAWFDAGIWPADEGATSVDLDEPIGVFARRLIASRDRRLRRDSKRALHFTPGELHGLRIHAKKQRYALEFLSPLFPGRALGRYLDALRALQTLLGTLSDGVSATRLASDSARGLARADKAEGLVSGWTAAQMAFALKQLPDRIARLAACKPFWKKT
jgi:CHAD domain-containing protein